MTSRILVRKAAVDEVPTGAANDGNAVRACRDESRNVGRLDAADGNYGNGNRRGELLDEGDTSRLGIRVAWSVEHGAGDTPGRAVRFRLARFFDAVNARSQRDIGSNSLRIGHRKGVRSKLNTFRSYPPADIDPVVHDQPAAGYALQLRESLGEVVKAAAR